MNGHVSAKGSRSEVLRIAGMLFLSLTPFSVASAGEVLRLRAGQYYLQDQSSAVLTTAQVSSLAAKPASLRYYVVQFKDVIRSDDHAVLSARGVEPIRYLPDDALLVRGTAENVGFLKDAVPTVRAVVPYEPSWKISETLFPGQDPLLVTLVKKDESGRVAQAIRQLPGTKILGQGESDLVVIAEGSVVSQIAQIEGVEWIDAMPVMTTFDLPMFTEDLGPQAADVPTYTGFETGTKLMNFNSAWERGLTGQGQVAAIADTGVDTGSISSLHPDLTQVKGGFAIGMGSTSWEDPQGHGTHVSGSVVSSGAGSEGRIRGGASGAEFYVVGLWSPIMNNLYFSPDFQKIAGSAFERGARVHSNSWGSARDLGAYDSFARSADEYLWNNPDMLMLFAAGNSGEDKDQDGRIDTGSVCSPGTAKNVLTVGASENYLLEGGIQKKLSELRDGTIKWGVEPIASDRLSDNPNGLAAFSSRGPTRDGRVKPEIVAPGTNIVSTRSKHKSAGALWGEYGTDYAYAGGTSMATPLTAGAATVVRQYLVRDRGVAQPSGALVKATLIHTSFDLFPGQYTLDGGAREYDTRRPNVHEGYGRVDVSAATSLPEDASIVDDRKGLSTGEERGVDVTLPNGGSIRATLSYTDAPGAVSAARTLVNNLDLRLLEGTRVVLEKNDSVNNSEMLEISGLPSGHYRLVVKGTSVPMGKGGKQPFALLVSTSQ